MTRLHATAAMLARLLTAVFIPDSDQEASVLFGLGLLALMFILAGLPLLALGVPGTVYVLVGLGFRFGGRS